jgi:hypothetical protein
MSYCFSDSVNSVAQFGVGMRLALSVVLYHAHASSIDLIDRSCSQILVWETAIPFRFKMQIQNETGAAENDLTTLLVPQNLVAKQIK